MILQSTKYQKQNINLSSAPWTMHEFFAGSGLVAYGLKGMFMPVWANDISEQKAAVYEANFGFERFILDDIKNIKGRDLPFAHLSWASFPCQDLSLAGSIGGIHASRSGLVWEWLRVLDEMDNKPKILLLENVAGLLSTNGDYVCTDPQTVFSRPNRIDPSVPIDATILPTNFSDLRYYWDCPKDYLLRRLMGFSPGVNESYGYGQQIHNLLALLHETLPNSNVDDAWIESQVDGHFNLRYTRGEPLEAMKAAAKRILKNYLHDDPELRSKVLHAEKPFEFIIGDAMISGTIDLLNKADPAGENEAKVEIVDFKTGKSGDDLAAAERRSHVQQQLQMYAIATQDALGLEPLKATAHFLYANQPHIKEDVELSEEQMENMKHQIANTVTAIKQGRFPLCASKTRCTSCDFKAICNGSTR